MRSSCRGRAQPISSSASSLANVGLRSLPGSSRRRSRGCRMPGLTAPRPSCRGAARTTCRRCRRSTRRRSYLAHLRDAWNAAVLRRTARTSRTSCSPCRRRSTPWPAISPCRPRAMPACRTSRSSRSRRPPSTPGSTRTATRGARRSRVGDTVLVCDIGGGTTDFSLIAVRDEGGELVLERVAVGDHILLGGDNMDLTLAYSVRERLAQDGTPLDAWQFRSLESELSRGQGDACSAAPRTPSIRSPSSAAAARWLAARCASTSSTPRSNAHWSTASSRAATSATGHRRSAAPALQEIGLPYATDPAVTRHLAHFLSRQEALSRRRVAHPRAQPPCCSTAASCVPRALRERLVDVLNGWFGTADRRRRPRAQRRRSGARGGARRGVLRLGTPRPRRAHPRRHGARLLHRHRDRDARGARSSRRRSRRCASSRTASRKAARSSFRRRSSDW